MIEFENFFIPHVGKTGGDAIKTIAQELNLPIVTLHTNIGKKIGLKHTPPRHLFGKKDLVLPIRRLPQREISKLNQLVYRDKTITWDEIKNPAEYILNHTQGERHISKHTLNGTLIPKFFIRSEFLIEDFCKVLDYYFGYNSERFDLMKRIETKERMCYERDIFCWFTPNQILKLYQLSPIWNKYEKMAYPMVCKSRKLL